MATTSQVEAGLDEIAARINAQRAVMTKAKSNAAGASDALDAIAADFGDVISTVQGYGTENAYEAATKAKFERMVAEFGTLKGVADTVAAIDV